MKPIVDQEKCISCGNCLQVCPDVFAYDESNKAIVQKEPDTPELQECSKKAAEVCPTQAITIEE